MNVICYIYLMYKQLVSRKMYDLTLICFSADNESMLLSNIIAELMA